MLPSSSPPALVRYSRLGSMNPDSPVRLLWELAAEVIGGTWGSPFLVCRQKPLWYCPEKEGTVLIVDRRHIMSWDTASGPLPDTVLLRLWVSVYEFYL